MNADEESFARVPDLERLELTDAAAGGDERWSDALYARYWAQKRQSLGEYEPADWLSAERQAFGVEPDDEEPE
jgi:hypothetical protein